MVEPVPVLCLDGPSGAGKGTIARLVAERLGWRYLDSGALYRLVGWSAVERRIRLDDESNLERLVRFMNAQFDQDGILLDGREVGDRIRSEEVGNYASQIAAIPAVRQALLVWQRSQAKPPGLVADGRDMGTTVFPAANCKVFLTASAEERAKRRYKQLSEKGFNVNLARLCREIGERDARDANRSASPLRPAVDAVVIDTTKLSIAQVVEQVLDLLTKAMRGQR